MNSSRTWCPYLFHGLMMTPTAEVRPCCRFDTSQYEESFYLPQGVTLDAFYHSSLYENFREAAKRGEPIAGCRRCYEEEALGVKSMRQKEFLLPDQQKHTNSICLTNVEIPAGRTCNLKCRSCNASYSTKWDQDAAALSLPRPKSADLVDLNLVPLDFFSAVKTLKVSGGEPCLSRPLIRFLNRLSQIPQARNMEIQFYTNATVKPPDELLASFAGFKSIDLKLSIDAVGEQNTYLRHPSSWPVVEDTVKIWHREQKGLPRLNIGFAVTVSVLNILSLFDLLRWIYQHNPQSYPQVVFQIVHDPDALNVNLLPLRQKQVLYEAFQRRKAQFLQENDFKSWPLNLKKIEQLFLNNSPRAAVGPKAFWGFLHEVDALRNENAKATFSELTSLLDTYAE